MNTVQHKPNGYDSRPVPATYVVGQDLDGHWLALETHGLAGGIFKTRRDAVRFACFESDAAPEAVAISPTPLTLRF